MSKDSQRRADRKALLFVFIIVVLIAGGAMLGRLFKDVLAPNDQVGYLFGLTVVFTSVGIARSFVYGE